MKLAFFFLFIGFGCLILLNYLLKFKFHNTGVDIHFRDSYYVLSYSFLIIFSILLLTTLFTLGGVIYYGFKNKNFWILFSILVFADSYYTFSSINMFKQLNNKVKELEKNGWKSSDN
jgi:hypothetical protein